MKMEAKGGENGVESTSKRAMQKRLANLVE
jgi:hypothetical protein